MDHVGCTRQHTALHHLQLAKVLNPAGASAQLLIVDLPTGTSHWNDVNVLKRFICLSFTHSREKLASRKVNLFLRIESYW